MIYSYRVCECDRCGAALQVYTDEEIFDAGWMLLDIRHRSCWSTDDPRRIACPECVDAILGMAAP